MNYQKTHLGCQVKQSIDAGEHSIVEHIVLWAEELELKPIRQPYSHIPQDREPLRRNKSINVRLS